MLPSAAMAGLHARMQHAMFRRNYVRRRKPPIWKEELGQSSSVNVKRLQVLT